PRPCRCVASAPGVMCSRLAPESGVAGVAAPGCALAAVVTERFSRVLLSPFLAPRRDPSGERRQMVTPAVPTPRGRPVERPAVLRPVERPAVLRPVERPAVLRPWCAAIARTPELSRLVSMREGP